MHIFDVGKAAAHAEVQLLQQRAMRFGRQIALLGVAAVLGFFSLITGHALLWAIFRYEFGFGPVASPALVFFLDFLLALVFAFFGRRSYLYPAEVEAHLNRDRRINELKQSMTLITLATAVAGPLGRFVGNRFRKG
ncbi:phage holin family protein [Acetobacter sp.]|uniref:phage holin family protein n=1 Tax=Acetobacter sp. TaxID=440 RepID=UPI0039EBBA46